MFIVYHVLVFVPYALHTLSHLFFLTSLWGRDNYYYFHFTYEEEIRAYRV